MLEHPPFWFMLLAFVCALGPLIFIHELGHYLVAQLFGVGAEVFSIGFGREIFGWTDGRGTRWKIGWLPLGGYVRFVGDMNPASAPAAEETVPEELRSRSFHCKPVWQRFLIVLAGPVANFILGILIFAAILATSGMPRASNVIGQVAAGSAAEQAGIAPGDRILSIAGQDTESFQDIRRLVLLRPGQRVRIQIQRGGAPIEIHATLAVEEEEDPFGRTSRIGLLGVAPSGTLTVEQPSMAELIPEAFNQTVNTTRMMIDILGQIITGSRSAKELGGPLRIAQAAGEQASLSFLNFAVLAAILSINLGFINLLPVPLLDGGHLFFYAVEAVRRRPVSLQAQDWAFRGGLTVLLALLVFTTVNDLDSFGLWDRLERLIG